MKKTSLMIHELNESFFDSKNLENYILTFDDGLYCHFYYYEQIKKINTEKIFFISTDHICEGKQSFIFPHCKLAHEKSFNGNKEDYMTLEQILFLKKEPQVTIGGHSHFHKNLNNFQSLREKVHHIKKDTELMLEWFDKNLNFLPKSFCFPYNNDVDGLYKTILKTYGFTDFFGSERSQLFE